MFRERPPAPGGCGRRGSAGRGLGLGGGAALTKAATGATHGFRLTPPLVLPRSPLLEIDTVPLLSSGGRPLGGRIGSLVADAAGVSGLVCLGYTRNPLRGNELDASSSFSGLSKASRPRNSGERPRCTSAGTSRF